MLERASGRCKLAGFLALIAARRSRAQLRRRSSRSCSGWCCRARCCSCCRCCGPSREHATLRDGDHAARRSTGSASRSRTRCCCASCRTATAIVVDVLVGTFVGDTGAYFGGRAFGRRPLAPRDLAEQDGRGAADRDGWRRSLGVWFAGLYQDWLSGADALLLGLGVGDRRARSATCSSRSSSATLATKDTGRLFGAHGGALDRLDAVLFTAVVGYYIWHALA